MSFIVFFRSAFSALLSMLALTHPALSTKLQCPKIELVHEAITVLQKENKNQKGRDIFDLHPEWDKSPACIESIFREYISIPEKTDHASIPQEQKMSLNLRDIRKGFTQSLKNFAYLKKTEASVMQETKNIQGIKFVKFHNGFKPDMVVLYLHGGGYILNYEDTCGFYIDMLSKLVIAAHAEVYVPYYRVRPEAPLSASLEDAEKAYNILIEKGVKPEKIVIMGDSAGGGLVLRLLLQVKNKGMAMPHMAVVLSPWSDMTNSGESYIRNAGRDMFSNTAGIDSFTKAILEEMDPKDPLVSPSLADYTGFPPLLYVVSGGEICLDDTLNDIAKAKRQGVDVQLILHQDGVHVYPCFARFLESGRDALSQLIEKIKFKKN